MSLPPEVLPATYHTGNASILFFRLRVGWAERRCLGRDRQTMVSFFSAKAFRLDLQILPS